jgi:hypothetical protein
MGQYYKSISIDKQEFMDAHSVGNGVKLMEHSWVGNNFMQIIEALLTPGQSWYKTRIVWAGDYMDDGLFLEEGEEKNLYHYVDNHFREISPEMVIEDGYNIIVNHTKSQYCRIPAFKKNKWQPHPLSLLTSLGNGRGGGDYRVDNPFTGAWAGDVLSIEKRVPKGFKRIIPNFIED